MLDQLSFSAVQGIYQGSTERKGITQTIFGPKVAVLANN